MPEQPNKPGGEKDTSVADRQAVRNQGEATPDDYPEPAAGEQVKSRDKG